MLLGLLMLNVPLSVIYIIQRRRSRLIRSIETGLAMATCAIMIWIVADGPVLMVEASDQAARFGMGLIAAITLMAYGIKWLRRVRPAPERRVEV